MAGGEELGQDTGEQLDLTRAADELVVNHRARVDLVLDALEQEGVLADLPELHELVAQTLDTARFAAKRTSTQTPFDRHNEKRTPWRLSRLQSS